MKSGLLIIIGAVFLTGAGYVFSTKFGGRDATACAVCEAASLKTGDALAWMKHDFNLTDDEFTKVCALHDAYLPKCDAMCRRMGAATERLSKALQASPSLSGEADAALHEYETARDECQRETLKHVLDTAAAMKPEAGRAFVQKVLPHLLTSRQHVRDLHH